MLVARSVLAVARFAVHLVRADVDEAFDAAAQPRGLEQRVRAQYIVLGKRKAVAKAIVNMRLAAPERARQARVQPSAASARQFVRACAAKFRIVSISFSFKMWSTKSVDVMSPLMNCTCTRNLCQQRTYNLRDGRAQGGTP